MQTKSSSSLKRILVYFKPYRIQFILSMFCILIAAISNAAIPYITGLPMTEITKNVKEQTGVNFSYVFKMLLILTIVGILYCLTQFLANYFITNVVQNSMRDLRSDIEEKINRLPVAYFDQNQQGNILSRVTNDVDALGSAMQQSFVAIVNALLGIIFAVSMMLFINIKMALLAMLMIPASLVISKLVVRFSQKYFGEQQNALGDMNGFVQENMTGFSVIKLFSQEQEAIKGFEQVNHRLYHYGFRASAISGLMNPLVALTAYSAYIVMAVLGSFYVIQAIITVGQLQAFIQYVWQISQPMGQITQLSSVLQSASAATGRVFEILDESEEQQQETIAELPEQFSGRVEFKNVSFSYSPERPLIQNLNFEAKPGQKVAIVGPTGAGKTTLINLLMRFYDADSGAILIDGVNTQEMERSDVRELFGMVLQDAWLYNDTILENIRFGKLDATDYEVVDAATTANVDHFIRTMPDGYEMEINPEGSNISLGQKQLMTIARAVIKDPKILILDEATSSVDTRLESLIQTAMDKIMVGRTSFVIAHRLSTIRNADLILVMKDGHIIEQGTHDSLLEAEGFYEKLYNSQFAEDGDYD